MAYFASKQPEYNYLHHLFLIGWDFKKPLTVDEIVSYVAHVDPNGKPDGWFFDSFLSFTIEGPGGNYLSNDINLGTTMSGEGNFFAVPSPNPSWRGDWIALLESEFAANGMWGLMDQAIDRVAEVIGPPKHKRNAVVSVPYPAFNQLAFDRTGDRKLNFSIVGQNLTKASEQRLEACKWFVDETIKEWEKLNPKNLHLLGFYWLFETMAYSWEVDDHWVWKELYKYVRERGYRMFWIPFYSSMNVNLLGPGRDFYFDCACLQPNHMFYENIEGVEKAALEAKERGAGFEMEYLPHDNPQMRTMKDRQRRFKNYLDGGTTCGYMNESVCAYFCGMNDLHDMAMGKLKGERKIYDLHYEFVAGTYKP